MTSPVLITLYIIVVINLVLSAIIFSRGFKNRENILFTLITLSSAFWGVSIIGFYSPDLIPNLNWVQFTHSFALLVAFVFLGFSIYFPHKLKRAQYILSTFGASLLCGFYLIQSGNVIGSKIDEFHYELESGYLIYASLLILYFLSGYYFLYRQYKKSSKIEERQQVKYVAIGSVLSSSLAIIPDLIFPYLGIFQYTWLGPLFTLILVISIFVAILKYHLFNIKVLATELASTIIVVLLISEIFLSRDQTDLIIKTIVLIAVTILSYLLIKGVYKEVESREKIQKLAEDLEKANMRLRELDKQKSEFLSFATHQLRSPLTAIKGYASLIQEETFGKIERPLREAVDHIFQATEGMILMVEDFLNISRIEQGRMKYEFSDVDVSELTSEIAMEMQPTALKKKLELILEKTDDPLIVSADPGKLRQVIANIIDNSIKYTPSGSIKVATSRTPDKAIITIKDTGIGISEKEIHTLFEKFSRAKNANRVNVTGTGLGLYLAKKIVEEHKGRINVHSEGEGKGSTFRIELPLK